VSNIYAIKGNIRPRLAVLIYNLNTYYHVIRSIIYCSLMVLVISCKNKPKVDVSHIKTPVEVVRIDKLIANVKNPQDLSILMSQHKAFMDIYLSQVLLIEATTPDSILAELQLYAQDSLNKSIQLHVDQVFTSDQELSSQLEDMYKHFKHYFPKYNPSQKVYAYTSTYAMQMFTFLDDRGHDAVAIGLDMFLSPRVDYKSLDPDNTNFSDYITRSWNPDHITKKIAEANIKEMHGEPKGFKLIDMMIHNGKELYILDQILPSVHDSVIHEYTKKQLDWCENNAKGLWSHFIDKKLFYESAPSKINKYISPSPFSPDMPSEAPGRTANYLGYEIVKAYMDKNPDTTLDQLMATRLDGQQILDKSKYKPKR
jgi:hypothetical protein